MRPKVRSVGHILAALASDQHGLATTAQMLAAAVTPSEIKHRIADGSLIRVYRGVYRVGHAAPNLQARYLGAVLAGGADALLCARAAAYAAGLVRGVAPPPEVMTRTHRRIAGVRTRRCAAIPPPWMRDGIPLTPVPRTLVDLAAELSLDDLARACHEAGVKYRTTPRQLRPILERYPRLPGAGKLRDVILGETPVVLSRLEKGFLALLKNERFPLPQTNRVASGRRVDCRWPDHRLTVELDSYRFHNTRYAWEQDRRREREAYARGDQHRRYTYGDVFESPFQMLAELEALLPRS